jgi:hypothetical protein
MELTDIKTTDREVEFQLPDGTKTGLFLTLRYDSAEEVQKVDTKYRAKFMEASRKGRFANRDRLSEAYTLQRRIAHVAGWRWTKGGATFNDEQPEFSLAKLKEFLDFDGQISYFLAEFIDQEVGDASDFLESVASS